MNSTDTDRARCALRELLQRIVRNIANDRLLVALMAAAEERARARRRQ